MRRLVAVAALGCWLVLLVSGPAAACGGLIAPNGAVNLLRTTTLAAYHAGIEHYVTSFEFLGGGAEFGSIVPLPGVPSKVTRGGEWTLQRLEQEVQPVVFDAAGVSAARPSVESAKVILEKEIDGLKITVLKGGALAVGNWARVNGFNLTPDAPAVLDFYARRSPVFMAVRFDPADASRHELVKGDGVPIHLRIPTTNPWVPLRILALGKSPDERIQADVFLLTDRAPVMLPSPVTHQRHGLILDRSELASRSLTADLRADKGMAWMPHDSMWLTFLRLDENAGRLTYDLAIDASGAGQPSPLAAGFGLPIELPPPTSNGYAFLAWLTVPLAATGVVVVVNRVIGRLG